jgi:hypothetical protein
MPNPWNRDGNAVAPADFLGTTNNLPLKIRTNNTEQMRIGVAGNVGIGTSAPATKLHVEGDRIQLESGGRQLLLRTDGAEVDVQSETNNLFLHSSGPANRNNVMINPFGGEGNVGIGTLAPATKLHVEGDRIQLESGGRQLLLRSDGADVDVQSETSNIFIHTSGPTGRIGKIRAPRNNVVINPFEGEGNVGVGTLAPATKLHVVGERVRLESGGRQLLLRSDGADVDVESETNNVFIHSSGPGGRNNVVINPFGNEGNVGIGTGAPGTKLEVAGDIRANDVFLTSDARLKGKVAPVDGALEKLRRIRGVSFVRLDDREEAPGPSPRRLGVVAQEVNVVLPELVDARSEGAYLGVDYSGLTAVLIEAMKELMAENADLRQRMDHLEKVAASADGD